MHPLVQANVNAIDRYGCNALHYAMCAMKQNVFLCRILCQSGVDPTTKNQNGETPLHLAAKENKFTLIPVLLEHASNVDVRDNRHKT